MLSLLMENQFFRIAALIGLAAGCAFLYVRISKRRKEREAKAKLLSSNVDKKNSEENTKSPSDLLAELEIAYTANGGKDFASFLRVNVDCLGNKCEVGLASAEIPEKNEEPPKKKDTIKSSPKKVSSPVKKTKVNID